MTRDGDVIEQGLSGHAVVAVGVVGGDVALVAPEDLGLVPGDEGAEVAGEELVEEPRRLPA